MNLSIGIVGLPNVGKSTLFNALLGRQIAQASNYPFCTIDPNVGVVEVPDEKLQTLAKIVKTPKVVPAIVEFVDIAGLVKGAAAGEGLGNKFLTNIRDCDAICHVVRDFADENIIKEGSTDPQGDFEVICAELIIKDLETIDRYISTNKNKPEDPKKLALAQKLKIGLEQAKLAQNIELDNDEKILVKTFFLLTSKPYFIVANVDEATYKDIENWKLRSEAKSAFGGKIENLGTTVPICAKLENELSQLPKDDQKDFLADYGLEKSGLERLIKKLTTHLVSNLFILPVSKKLGHGRFIRAIPLQKLPVSSILILKGDLSWPKLSNMMISSNTMVGMVPKPPVSSNMKLKPT